jgi:Domain of unknown function (DUF5668)
MRVSSGDLIRAVRGPILLIVLGLLFVAEYFGGQLPFYKSWPVLLIVYGVLKLAEHLAPGNGTPAGGSL